MPDLSERDLLVRIDVNVDRLCDMGERAVTAVESAAARKDAAQAARYDIYKQVLQPKVVALVATAFSFAVIAIVVAVTRVDADILDVLHVAPAAEATESEASSDADDPQDSIDALDAASPGG